MRHLAIVAGALLLTACGTAPAAQPETASTDEVVQFLVQSAASDFHTHGPAEVTRFREVRLGHIVTSSGEEQYMLCGQYQVAREGEWVPFATIKTSGYEQWIGAQGEELCQRASVVWHRAADLESLLQGRLEALREGSRQ